MREKVKRTNEERSERTNFHRSPPTHLSHLLFAKFVCVSLSFITFTHSLSFSPIVSPFILSLNEMSERMTVKEWGVRMVNESEPFDTPPVPWRCHWSTVEPLFCLRSQSFVQLGSQSSFRSFVRFTPLSPSEQSERRKTKSEWRGTNESGGNQDDWPIIGCSLSFLCAPVSAQFYSPLILSPVFGSVPSPPHPIVNERWELSEWVHGASQSNRRTKGNKLNQVTERAYAREGNARLSLVRSHHFLSLLFQFVPVMMVHFPY